MPNDAECLDERCFPYDKPDPYRFRFISSEEAPFAWTSPEDGAGQRYLWSLNRKILDGELDPETYPPKRVEVLEAIYDAGIHFVDSHLGRLFEDLRRRGLFDRTAIVITSDHGEAFLDHSLFMHQEVYDPLLRVPLIVRLPSDAKTREGKVVEDPVQLADIVPTLLGLAGAEIPEQMTGRPLPIGAGGACAGAGVPGDRRELFAYYLFPSKFTYRSFAVRKGDWKLVTHNLEAPDRFRQELYNWKLDPAEQSPLSGEDEIRQDLQQSFGRWLHRPPVAQGAQLSEKELPDLEAVRSLGYLE